MACPHRHVSYHACLLPPTHSQLPRLWFLPKLPFINLLCSWTHGHCSPPLHTTRQALSSSWTTQPTIPVFERRMVILKLSDKRTSSNFRGCLSIVRLRHSRPTRLDSSPGPCLLLEWEVNPAKPYNKQHAWTWLLAEHNQEFRCEFEVKRSHFQLTWHHLFPKLKTWSKMHSTSVYHPPLVAPEASLCIPNLLSPCSL